MIHWPMTHPLVYFQGVSQLPFSGQAELQLFPQAPLINMLPDALRSDCVAHRPLAQVSQEDSLTPRCEVSVQRP